MPGKRPTPITGKGGGKTRVPNAGKVVGKRPIPMTKKYGRGK